jgi:hypothetical protein
MNITEAVKEFKQNPKDHSFTAEMRKAEDKKLDVEESKI